LRPVGICTPQFVNHRDKALVEYDMCTEGTLSAQTQRIKSEVLIAEVTEYTGVHGDISKKINLFKDDIL
jgi:hypothetical protein